MDGQRDGAIIIDAGINGEEFKSGVEDLRKAMESLTDAIERIGKKMESAVSAYAKSLAGGVKDVQRLRDGVEQTGNSTKSALSDMTAKTKEMSAAADKAAESYGKAAGEAEKAKAALSGISEAESKAATSAQQTGKDIESATKSAAEALRQEIHSMTGAVEQYDRDFQNVQSGALSANSALLESWLEGYEKAAKRYQAIRLQFASMNESGELSLSEGDLSKITDGLFKLEERARASQEAIKNFAREAHIALGENEESAPVIANLEPQIEAAEAALARFQARTAKMDAIGASDKAWASIEYDIGLAADEAERLQSELDALSESGGIDETQYESLSQRLQDAVEGFAALTGAADETEEETRKIPPVIRGIGAAFSIPLRAFGALASAAGRVGAELAKMTGEGFLRFMRMFAASVEEAAKNLMKMSATAVSSGVKRLGAWLSNAAKSMTLFGRSAKRNNGILKKSFSTILKYGLGVRSFYYLFRKIRQAISEGYQNLARYSSTLNQSISGVISSFKKFENQFAASFAPLVNALAPAISQLIDGLTEATYRAGQFIAVLSGQKTVIRAKEIQEDFAASLEETKKAAKAAQNQLAGFDELNILKKPDEEGANPEDMFETVPVGDEAKSLADKFKEAWVNVDLTEIGEIVGGKLKVALDGIPWDKIKQAASDMGKRLATFLNGLINVPGLGKSLGKSIAEAINTAFSFLDGFAWTFDWKGLGNTIMDTVEAACDNLEWERINSALQGLATGLADLLNTIFSRKEVWEKVGKTLGKALNAIVDAGITFLEKFDFKQAASAIVAGLNAMIDEIEWDDIGRLLADAFGGALQFLYTAITEFHWADFGDDIAEMVNEFVAVMLERIEGIEWSEIGAKIAEGINHAVSGIEWDKAGELIGKLIGGALSVVATFIRNLDYGEIVQAIQDFFSNAIQQIDFYDLLTVWGVAALIVALKTVIAAHPLLAILVGAVLALGPELGNAIDKMMSDIPWAEVGQNISNFLVSALNRLNEAIESVDWQKLGTDLWNALVDVVTNIQWSDLISKIFELLGAAVGAVAGLIVGFAKGIWESLKSAFESTKEYFSAYIEEAGGDIIKGLLNGIGNALLNIGTWIYEHIFKPFIDGFCKAFGIASPSTVMEEQGGFIISGLFNGISAAWHTITDFFSGALDGLITTLGGAWDTISGAASTAWNGISTTLSGVMGEIKTSVGASWDNVKKRTSETLSELGKTASGKWQGLKTDAAKAWNDLKTAVGQSVSSVKQDAVSRVSETVNSIRPQWARIKTDAVSEWNALKSSVVSSALSVKAQVASAFTSLQGTLSGVWGNIRSAASGALSSVSSTVSSMATSISSRVSSIRATVSNITSSASDALSKVADKMDDLTRKTANTVTIGGFASGGVIRDGGRMSWYDSVRKYASGTARAAGSLFVAGEAGPELVGHVNGRTEVLNESQIASAIYSAVLTAMQEAVSTLGGFLSQQMATNANALITAIGQLQVPESIAVSQTDAAMMERLAALSAAPYQTPVYATGTVMPYEITAEIKRSTDKITGCIDSNTEELIKTMIGAFSSQTATLVSALSALKELSGQRRGASFNDMKDAANTWTQMYGKSPFYG